jgi:hypothetical protein
VVLDAIDRRAEAAAVSGMTRESQRMRLRAINHPRADFSTPNHGSESRGSPKSAHEPKQSRHRHPDRRMLLEQLGLADVAS